MWHQLTALSTRVSRRIVLLFLASAVVPAAALSYITWRDVTAELQGQMLRSLRADTKQVATDWLAELRLVGTLIDASRAPGSRARRARGTLPSGLEARVTQVTVERAEPWLSRLDARQRAHVLEGGSVLLTTGGPGEAPRVLLLRGGAGPAVGEPLLEVAAVRVDDVFAEVASRALSAERHAWLVDARGQVLARSPDAPAALPHGDDDQLLTASFMLPMRFDFAEDDWLVVGAMSRDLAQQATARFLRHFGLVVLGALGLVALLSLVQIRRNLAPLAALRESARRLAAHDFDTPVAVASGDEFEGLARAFDDLRRGLKEQFARLERLHLGTVNALARAIDAKSPWTAGHSERVTALGVALAERIGLAPAEVEVLRVGGLLHDIGKIGIPKAVLDKDGPLTPAEQEVMRQHPEMGARILAPIPEYADVLPIVAQHHERYDGRGYPRGLKGDAIAIGARVFAVADVFDALTSSRPYRPGLPVPAAVALMQQGRGTHFDPHILDAFCALVAEGRIVAFPQAPGPSREVPWRLAGVHGADPAPEAADLEQPVAS